MTSIHHAIDYIELAARDLRAATDFYAQAFGWQFNDYGPDYAGIRAVDGEGEVGGINATGQAEPGPGGPLVLLYSEDLEATVAAVRAAGGTVTAGLEPDGAFAVHAELPAPAEESP